MSLKIYLLGQFRLQTDKQRIELPSRPAQSLWAYLCLNAGVTQRREKLASLLWPEASESNARSYLRQALWRVRKALEEAGLEGQAYLQVNDLSVTFNEQADYWLDAEQMLRNVPLGEVEALVETLGNYRGELLPGFYEEWVLVERDRFEAAYHQKMSQLLEGLNQAGRWAEALEWGEQWIRLGYAPEAAFRGLMVAHAGMGDQSMVGATYQRCVEALQRELGLEPSAETERLYEQLCRGEPAVGMAPAAPVVRPPGEQRPRFLEEGEPHVIERPLFVARERELEQLEGYLGQALAGRGQVCFVTGEAGSGKTALIQEFTQRAQEAHAELIVAGGNCNAYTGLGDPYLPFREIMELLTGDVEARWFAGAMTDEHARRLWSTLPLVAQAIVGLGPDLIDTFVAGAPLVERAAASVGMGEDWWLRLQRMAEHKASAVAVRGLQQSDLFMQYTRVLQSLARQSPLILLLDDLQWADSGSINLLFHLGRELAGSCILVLGAFRPEEVATGRDGSRHPLEPVLNEFQRVFGGISVNVGQDESREFVEALLDSEPNRLGSAFRQMLYRQTRGHPLFTIELLRGLQERGDLVRDLEDHWVEGPALDWERLPARVEAVIAERIGRLPMELPRALAVASVEGEVFTAEVVAQVLEIDERKMVQSLSNELDRRHHLVSAQAIERLGARRVSRYRFRNYLFQRYLYDNLDEVERAYLHEDVGNALERLHAEKASEIAVQLAWHFEEAGITEKTVDNLNLAGERALQLSAYQEAIAHLTRGVKMLADLPDTARRAERELSLLLALGRALQGAMGAQVSELKDIFIRARELGLLLGKTTPLCQALGGLAIFYYVRGEQLKAHHLAEEALDVAEQNQDALLEALCHWYLGFISFCLGQYATALENLEQVVTFYDRQRHHDTFLLLRGSDAGPGALAYIACSLWCLGYPDQAYKKGQEALNLARKLGHPFTMADVLCFAGCMLNSMSRDNAALKQYAEDLMGVSHEKNLAGWLAVGTRYRGEALARMGQDQEGIGQMREGLAGMKEVGVRLYFSGGLGALAEALIKAGEFEEGLCLLDEALLEVEQTHEHHWEVELHRLKGELLCQRADVEGAQASFEKALEVARRQEAKSWELRAAIGLARLWQEQGKMGQAREILQGIYGWFSEGFETQDLKEARELLENLG